VSCLEVRDRLTEHALGLLTKVDAAEVQRHLEWCAGCRKESAELEEGAARMALALPIQNPSASLETRVVDRVRSAAGRIPATGRHRGGRLVAVTLVAALLAMGAMGWAIAERGHLQSLKATVSAKEAQVARLARILESFRGEGKTLRANLAPAPGAPGGRGGGSAVIFSAPNVEDIVFVDILLPASLRGPFVVQVVDNGAAMKVGRGLVRQREGDWVQFARTRHDLSRVVTITVLDNASRTVLTGTVHRFGD
jgi:hypothetical protein